MKQLVAQKLLNSQTQFLWIELSVFQHAVTINPLFDLINLSVSSFSGNSVFDCFEIVSKFTGNAAEIIINN